MIGRLCQRAFVPGFCFIESAGLVVSLGGPHRGRDLGVFLAAACCVHDRCPVSAAMPPRLGVVNVGLPRHPDDFFHTCRALPGLNQAVLEQCPETATAGNAL